MIKVTQKLGRAVLVHFNSTSAMKNGGAQINTNKGHFPTDYDVEVNCSHSCCEHHQHQSVKLFTLKIPRGKSQSMDFQYISRNHEFINQSSKFPINHTTIIILCSHYCISF